MKIIMSHFNRIFLFASLLLLPVLNSATAKMEVYVPYKNDALSKKILRGYLKAFQKENGQLTSLAEDSESVSFVAIPNIHFKITESNEEFVTVRTDVWGQKDTFDNTKVSILPKEKKLLSGKIVQFVDSILVYLGNEFREWTNQLPQYDHKQVSLSLDSYTKVYPRVLYDANRGCMRCETRIPKQLFLAEIERLTEKWKRETLTESIIRAYLQKMKNSATAWGKPDHLQFEFATEGNRVILKTDISGQGHDLSNFCSSYPSAYGHDSLTQKILAAYAKNRAAGASVTKLDKHTKCNAPVYYDQADNGWMRCQTVLSLAQFEAIKCRANLN